MIENDLVSLCCFAMLRLDIVHLHRRFDCCTEVELRECLDEIQKGMIVIEMKENDLVSLCSFCNASLRYRAPASFADLIGNTEV